MGQYEELGVSADKKDVHEAIKHQYPGISASLFCKTLPDIFCGDPNYCVISHADGAGTKSSLAYAYWKETGDTSVFSGLIADSIGMNTDDVLCVGAFGRHAPMVLSAGVERNKNKIPGEVIALLINATDAHIEKLRSHGLDISSGGGETADVGDLSRTLSVNHTLTTRMPRAMLIDTADIQEGDVIVGLASFGKATYEDTYNSGIGSNGLTLARHGLFSRAVADKYPETFDPELGAKAYRGTHLLTDMLEGTPLTIGQAVLSPTRTYAPILVDVIGALGVDVHALIHCSGGGQTKAGKFLAKQGLAAIKDNVFESPHLFAEIQRVANVDWKEMYEVFNMGHRMEVYCPAERAQDVIALSERFGVAAQVVGRVVRTSDFQVKVTSQYGEFTY